MTLTASFYSFKGGVGRTMSLVNTAVLLTQAGYRVVVWDLDLEAPGVQSIPYMSKIKKIKGGFVDLAAAFFEEDGLQEKSVARLVVTHPANKRLALLPAGKLNGKGYFSKYVDVPWDRLFDKEQPVGYELFSQVQRALVEMGFDFILVDSRTGFTDISGVCTIQLPDIVFLVFNYGEQNLAGTRMMYQALTNPDVKAVGGRVERVYLVASMVPHDRPELLLKRRVAWRKFNLNPHVEIPYNGEVALTERVWTSDFPDHPLSHCYASLAQAAISAFGVFHPDVQTDTAGFRARCESLFEMLGYQLIRCEENLLLRYDTPLATQTVQVLCVAGAVGGKRVINAFANQLSTEQMIVSEIGFHPEAERIAKEEGISLRTYDALIGRLIPLEPYRAWMQDVFVGSELEKNFVEPRVKPMGDETVVSMTPYVMDWLAEAGPGLMVLVGEFGTGKTSFAKRLGHEIWSRRDTDERLPGAVFVRLRQAPRGFTLEGLVHEHFKWEVGIKVRPEAVLHLLIEGRLVLILDGLDEMAPREDAAELLTHFQEIGRFCRGKAKIIVTARQHLFWDSPSLSGKVVEGTVFFQELQKVPGSALGQIQPFTSAQISRFLKKSQLDGGRKVRAMLQKVEGLVDLATRPVFLNMIVKSLETLGREGDEIHPTDLYHAYVNRWCRDESTTGRLNSEDRARFIEALASRLWAADNHQLHRDDVNILLVQFLGPAQRSQSSQAHVSAATELRTATFIRCDDNGFYSFAHRSFLEYFLACNVSRHLSEDRDRCLDNRPFSKEIVYFLSRLGSLNSLLSITRGILSDYFRRRVSVNAVLIHYWLLRYDYQTDGDLKDSQGFLERTTRFNPKKINLQGADLSGMVFSWMDFSGADLSGIDGAYTQFDGCLLKNARLNSAYLPHANFTHADLKGADFSDASVTHADFANAKFESSTDLLGARLNQACFRGSNPFLAKMETRQALLIVASLDLDPNSVFYYELIKTFQGILEEAVAREHFQIKVVPIDHKNALNDWKTELLRYTWEHGRQDSLKGVMIKCPLVRPVKSKKSKLFDDGLDK